MLLLLLPYALAADYAVTCESELLEEVLAAAKAQSNPVVLTLGAGCDATTSAGFLALDASVPEYTLVTDGALADPFVLPPLSIDGTTVHLERVSVQETAAFAVASSTSDAVLGATPDVAIYVYDGTLDVQGLTMDGVVGAGIVLVSSTLESTLPGVSLDASNFSAARPLYAFGDAGAVRVDLGSANLHDNRAGAAALYNATATFADATFTTNGPAQGADLLASGGTLTVTTAELSGSDGGAGAPVDVDGGSFTCEDCNFTATSGTYTTVYANLDGSDSVLLSGGVYAPATAADPVIKADGSGAFATWAVVFRGAGTLASYTGSTNLGPGTHFEGNGRSPGDYVISLNYTTAVLEGVTFCDQVGTGWGIIEWSTSNGADSLDIHESVVQGMNNPGAYFVRDPYGVGDIDLQDNTFSDMTGGLVRAASGSVTFVNNLVVNADGGFDLAGAPDQLDYNLWYGVASPGLDGTYADHEVHDEDPRFVTASWSSTCGSGPYIAADSPANGAGKPGEDSFGNTPSDIGAIDVDDTPDSGADSGLDSGPPGPGDTGPGDLGSGLLGGGLRPCGCGTAAPSGALALLFAPLLARRRRA